jgi:hypothetical protein
MARNHEAEGEAPSPELPEDRIHYLLPPGCSDLTDLWALEKARENAGKRVIPPKAPNVLPMVPEKVEANVKISQIMLPEEIKVSQLAELLGIRVFEVIKAAIPLKAFLKATNLLPFALAAAICKILGVEAVRAEPPGGAAEAG